MEYEDTKKAPDGPSPRRELDPETEVAIAPGPIPLLQRYEGVIGSPLRKLPPSQQRALEKTGIPWPWSWTPEQCATFLQDWESRIYMAAPILRDLAMTKDPAGGGFLYERFCRPEIVDAIRKVQVMYDQPIGRLRPVPQGKFSVDLRLHPPNVRPTKFRINNWEFMGLVRNLPEDIRNQLAHMHSLWMEREERVMNPMDHPETNLGIVRGT